jgi:hypothetical protein
MRNLLMLVFAVNLFNPTVTFSAETFTDLELTIQMKAADPENPDIFTGVTERAVQRDEKGKKKTFKDVQTSFSLGFIKNQKDELYAYVYPAGFDYASCEAEVQLKLQSSEDEFDPEAEFNRCLLQFVGVKGQAMRLNERTIEFTKASTEEIMRPLAEGMMAASLLSQMLTLYSEGNTDGVKALSQATVEMQVLKPLTCEFSTKKKVEYSTCVTRVKLITL